jgi:hypothetical protein
MSRTAGRVLVVALLATVLGGPGTSTASAAGAPMPPAWPHSTLQLGMRDAEGGAAALRERTRVGLRYHYLSGGANTGRGWQTWTKGGGSFVPAFIRDSAEHATTPVFSLYQLRESLPGRDMAEVDGFFANLRSRDTMRAWFEDLRTALRRMDEAGGITILHVEPDLWGYLQRAARDDDPATVRVEVASTGVPELRGLPDTAAGLARAVVLLRDRHARGVQLGYSVSDWGTGHDLADSDPSDAGVDEMAMSSARFAARLTGRWDVLFAEFDDRDNGYARVRDGDGGRSTWDAEDFRRHARYLGGVSARTGKRIVLWQIPLGHEGLPDSPRRYRDNRVATLLGDGGGAVRRRYIDAGVIALLFGKAFPEATCACDDDGDGRDDDGGHFAQLSRSYVARGATRLPGASRVPPASARRTSKPSLRITSRPRSRAARRGGTIRVDVRVTARTTARGLLAVQLYRPGASKPTRQVPFRGQRFRKGIPRRYVARFSVPRDAPRGTWRVKVGVFDPDWRRLWSWKEQGGRIVVR